MCSDFAGLSGSENARYIERRRTCFIYSSGGHYAELIRALAGIEFSDAYHVTFSVSGARFSSDEAVERYFISHPRRRVVPTLRNIFDSIRLLSRKRPEIIISTGADVAAFTIIFGRLLFGCKTIFIESFGDIEPTLTGRMVYPFADLFVVQWEEKLKHFPRAVLSDGVLL